MYQIIDFKEIDSNEPIEINEIHNHCDFCGRKIKNIFIISDGTNKKCVGTECVNSIKQEFIRSKIALPKKVKSKLKANIIDEDDIIF